MPKVISIPAAMKPFRFHGVDLDHTEGNQQAQGDCPFCGKEGKFFVNITNGLWDCKVCGAGSQNGGGNIYTFIRLIHENGTATDQEINTLRAGRKLLFRESLDRWGVVKSPLTNEWLIPGYGLNGKMNQLYKYSLNRESGKPQFFATPELPHALHGVNLFDSSKRGVYLCEGPWDAIALWESLGLTKVTEEGLRMTASKESSLLSGANVLAVPGCNVFSPNWFEILAGKVVNLLYDNDHPHKHPKTGKLIEPAGISGMKRVAQLLAKADEPPEVIQYLRWGEHGYDLTKPSGFDVRDHLAKGVGNSATAPERVKNLQTLLAKVHRIPQDWLGSAVQVSKGHVGELQEKSCETWAELMNSSRKALHMTDGLEVCFSVCMACPVSTKAVGDQLWIKLIGPPSCGKSTLAEAMAANHKYVKPSSIIRGLHSGFRSSSDETEDNSLISKMLDKTLIIKDGDTLLQAPNRDQILSEFRDVYDRVSRADYRNKVSHDYKGISATVIICGTSALRYLDTSELGQRFLDVVIIEGSHIESIEDEIMWRKANQAERCMAFESDGKIETQHDPDTIEMMQMTAGYITYLRENAKRLLSEVKAPADVLQKCVHFAKFVAHIRARPSRHQNESAEREFGTRLASQLVRLAKSLAVVLNRDSVDEEVMRRVRKVALDTARGRTLDIVKHLYKAGDKGLSVPTLAVYTNQGEESERTLLKFLGKIGAVEKFSKNRIQVRWRLTKKMRRLFKEVMGIK